MATSLLGLSQRSRETVRFGVDGNMAPRPLRLVHGDRHDGPVLAESERGGEKTREVVDSRMGLTPQCRDATRSSRPDALQSVAVLEALEGLAAQHGAAAVPIK